MEATPSRRRRRAVLMIGATLAAIVLGSWLGWSGYRYWQVERAIARFEARPRQPAADYLGQLLEGRAATQRQAERILNLAFRPELRARHAYRPDRPPAVALEWPYRFNLSRAIIGFEAQVWIEGKEASGADAMTDYSSWCRRTYLPCGDKPLPVGTHQGRIELDCTVTRYAIRTRWWQRVTSLFGLPSSAGASSRPRQLYRARLEIPLEINVAEAEATARIRLVSDPELDRIVKQSLNVQCNRGAYNVFGHPQARGDVISLMWSNAPVALALQPVLRFPDGSELEPRPTDPGKLRCRRGDPGFSDAIHGTQFTLTPGKYEATVVLRPDPNFAYEDPAIKEIWGGTLEFAISFTLTEEPQPDGQREPKNETERTIPPTEGQTP